MREDTGDEVDNFLRGSTMSLSEHGSATGDPSGVERLHGPRFSELKWDDGTRPWFISCRYRGDLYRIFARRVDHSDAWKVSVYLADGDTGLVDPAGKSIQGIACRTIGECFDAAVSEVPIVACALTGKYPF